MFNVSALTSVHECFYSLSNILLVDLIYGKKEIDKYVVVIS